MVARQHVYIAAHFGDAVLSCGDQIAWQHLRGEAVLVLTLFAGVPDLPAYSSFASMYTALGGDKPYSARLQEEVAALRQLDAPFRGASYWPALFRKRPGGDWAYPTQEKLYGEVLPSELAIVGDIATSMNTVLQPGRDILYAPLAAGGHVDYKLTRAVAEKMASLGYPLYFYEDFPFAEEENAIANALRTPTQWQARLLHPPDEAWQAQLAALQAYPILLTTLFGSEQTAKERLQHYRTHLGGLPGRPALRLWQRAANSEQ